MDDEAMLSRTPQQVLLGAIRQGVRMAGPVFEKKRLAFSVDDHLGFVDKVESILAQGGTMLSNFKSNGSVDDVRVAALEQRLGFELPGDYKKFLEAHNGGEGFVGDSYLRLWPIDDLIGHNEDYQVQTYVPGFLAIGSNGGGEAYGFDTRTRSFGFVAVPFCGMDWDDALPMGTSFTDFLTRLGKSQ